VNPLVHLYRFSLRRPRLVVAIAALVTLAMAPGALRLTLRTDGHSLVPTGAAAVRYDQAIRDEFSIEDPIVVSIRSPHPDGVFNTGTLTLIRDLTARIQALDGLRADSVLSLSTERADRVYPGTLVFRPFLDPVPATPKEMARLRGDLAAVGLYTGTLVSFDGTMAAIFVGAPNGSDRTELARALGEVVRAAGPVPEEIHVIGAPVAEALLGHHILEDLGAPEALVGRRLGQTGATEGAASGSAWSLDGLRAFLARHLGLVPTAVVILGLVLYAAFRSVAATALALLKLGACLLLVFGLMGWLGVPIYLTLAVMPVLLIATGASDEIHIFTRYARELREHPEKGSVEALSVTLDELWEPVSKTSLATAFGFLSFVISPLPAVRAFGIFTGIGTCVCFLWALTVTTACAGLMAPERFVAPSRRRGPSPDGRRGPPLLARLGALVIRRPRIVLGGAALVLAASAVGASRVAVQDSWIDGFSPASEFYRATSAFNEQFLGTHVLLVSVGPKDPPLAGEVALLHRSEALERIGELERFIAERRQDAVGGVLGPASYLTTTAFLVRGRDPAFRVVPPKAERIADLWKYYARVRGARQLRQVVSKDGRRGLVTVLLKDANFVATRRLMDAVRAYERERLAPAGIAVGFAGDVAVSQALIEGIVTTQVGSLLLSIAGVLLSTALIGRSLRSGAYAVVPCSAAVLVNFGLMGWLGTPLGVATSMFASMTVGIGVDYAIHLLDRHQLELRAGRAPDAAVVAAMATTGRAILTNAVAVSLGFSVLVLSQVPANARLGARVSASIVGCMLGTLLLLPALLALRSSTRQKYHADAEDLSGRSA
jgi:uncharacterized protein